MTAALPSRSRKMLRDCILLLLLALVPALLTGWLHPKRPTLSWNKPGVNEVDINEVKQWPAPVIWIDARLSDAYQTRHIPGAIMLNEDNWEQLLPGFLAIWHPGTKIVVYCDSQACDASQTVAQRLRRELNLTEIHVLIGGWAAWEKSSP